MLEQLKYPAARWTLDEAIDDAAKQWRLELHQVFHNYDRGYWIIWHE